MDKARLANFVTMFSGDKSCNCCSCLNSSWLQGWESVDTAEWQSFDLSQHLDADQYLTEISIVVRGTGSGASGFRMLDLRILGTAIDNPTDTIYVSAVRRPHVVLRAQHVDGCRKEVLKDARLYGLRSSVGRSQPHC